MKKVQESVREEEQEIDVTSTDGEIVEYRSFPRTHKNMRSLLSSAQNGCSEYQFKRLKRNPDVWHNPEVRSLIMDYLNRELSSRAAASRISQIIGHSVSHSTVLMYANRMTRKESGDSSGAPEGLLSPSHEYGNVRYEIVKTSRGNENGLAIYESTDFVRVYRRTSYTEKSSFYRCSTCDHLFEKYGYGERPSIKVQDGVICSNPFPLHNPACKCTPETIFKRTQQDLVLRQLESCRKVLTNTRFKEFKKSQDATAIEFNRIKDGELAAKWIEESKKKSLMFSDENANAEKVEVIKDLLGRYRCGNIRSMSDLARIIQCNTGVHLSSATLWRHFKIGPGSRNTLSDTSYDMASFQEGGGKDELSVRPMLSKYLNETIITVPEENGFRQYSLMKKSADRIRSYYRCLGCARARRRFGGGRFAYIKVEFGKVLDRPLHHSSCKALTMENILVQKLDRECRKSIRKGEKDPKEAHVEGAEKAAELAASMGRDEPLFPSWPHVKNAYYRQKDLLRKASLAAEMNVTETNEYNIGDFSHDSAEERVGSRSEYSSAGLSAEINLLKKNLISRMHDVIRNEVTKAMNDAAVELERHIDEQLAHFFDEPLQYGEYEIFTPEENQEDLTNAEESFQGQATVISEAPFAIPEHYLNIRNRIIKEES